MAAETLLDRVKLAIRRTHSLLDSDLQADIDACLQDMRMRGVAKLDPVNPLVFAAIKLYCKSTTSDNPAEGTQWLIRYEALRDSMALSGDFAQPEQEDSNE